MLYLGLVAQLNRAPRYERDGRGFESLLALHVRRRRSSVDQELFPPKEVVGSSSLPGASTRRPVGPVAQLVEQGVLNPKVAGSIPVRPTSRTSKPASVAQLVEHPAFNRSVVGSSPSGCTNRAGSMYGSLENHNDSGHTYMKSKVDESAMYIHDIYTLRVGSSVDLEHRVSTPGVASSSLARPSKPSRQRSGSSTGSEHLPYKREVASSSLAPTTRRRPLCLESGRIQGEGRSSSGPGSRSPKPGTRVRISLGLPLGGRWQQNIVNLFSPRSSTVEQPPCKRQVAGSIPGRGLQSPLTTTTKHSDRVQQNIAIA